MIAVFPLPPEAIRHHSSVPDALDHLTGGLRRMWSTASLTSKLGVKAAVVAQPGATGNWREIIDELLASTIEPA